jgi:hypothetical protein
MSRHWISSLVIAFFIAIAGHGAAYSQETGKADLCSVLGTLAKSMPAASAGSAGVTLGDYFECIKQCKGELSGPDLTVCIEGCRFIDSGIVQGGDQPGAVFSKKDDLRDSLVRVAKMLINLGIDEFKCSSITTVDAACCRAWNNLLSTVKGGGNTFDAANRVLVECSGIG